MAKYKRWTEKEITFLKLNHKNKTDSEIAICLGRSVPSVTAKLFKLRLVGTKSFPVQIGEIFTRLTVVVQVENGRGNIKRYQCRCICGEITNVRGTALRNGTIRSCGCLHSEITSAIHRLEVGEKTLRESMNTYKYGAKKRKFSFSLNREQFKHLTASNCYYCGMEPPLKNSYINNDGSRRKNDLRTTDATSQRAWIKMNGIDRINNKIGYEIENCVSCCSLCNWMKREFDKEIFLSHIKSICDYQRRIS